VYSAPKAAPRGNSTLSCPRVISDTMDPTEHVDGKFYDSKSAFRAVTKREGFIEVGNDPARHKRIEKPKPDPRERRAAVEKATAQVLGN
jgi:hypothetical protein